MGKPLHWIVILQLSSAAFAYTYEPWYRGDTKRPVDVITDVINDLGVKILQQYSSHGNVAFSPTGVAFVLAALYEGAAGRGSQQIVDAVGLPADRDVTRIGFRDIHRRLRSYLNADGFLGGLTLSRENTKLRPEYEDILRFYGFDLSSIEQEANVTVSVEDVSTTTAELPTSSTVDLTWPAVATTSSTGSALETTTLAAGTAATTLSSSAATETTIAPSTATADVAQQTVAVPTSAPDATLGPVSRNTPTTAAFGESTQSTTVTSEENATGTPNTATTPMDSLPNTVTMVVGADDRTPIATTEVANGAGTTPMMMGPGTEVPSTLATTNAAEMSTVTNSSTPMETSSDAMAAASSIVVNMMTAATVTDRIPNTATSNSPSPVTPITLDTGDMAGPNPISGTDNSIVSRQNGGPSSMTMMTTANPVGDVSGMTTAIDLTTASMTGTDGTTAPVGPGGPEMTPAVSSVPAANGTSNDLAGNSSDSTTATSTSNDNQAAASPADENTVAMSRKKKSIQVTELEAGMRDITDDNTVKDESTGNKRRARSPRGYFSSYPDEGIWMQDLDIWKSYSTMSPRESSGDSTSEIAFLVNGCDVYSVSGSRYIAVLPFAYFPSLHAVALEFPLDDPRYNIILLMPTDRTDTHRLARDLSGKSLRLLRKRLQPTWVRATIPSFMLRGFVTLTSFLQRLGIADVFDPRVADLSPMTADLGVYARDVQQSIGVNIRNYMKPDRTHSRNGLFERAGPVPFTAMHPFLYFIVDTETSVSLIAGRVDDPLNSRIL